MSELDSQPEKPEAQPRFSQEQYEMLKRCSDNQDMSKWNQWRKDHSEYDVQDVLLECGDFSGWYLKEVDLGTCPHYGRRTTEVFLSKANFDRANLEKANLSSSYLEGARFHETHLEHANLMFAHLDNAFLLGVHLDDACLQCAELTDAKVCNAHLDQSDFVDSHLEGSKFNNAYLIGAKFQMAHVSQSTSFCYCEIGRETDFREVSLDSVRIEPATRQLLEYNIRRMNWEEWYKEHHFLKFLVKSFWWISDYGISTKRIIYTFFGLAFVFALLYRLFPSFVKVYDQVGDIRGFWHALYFSVVTMTTLGFGDIAANPDSWVGQTLLMIQVILGYVLLGALVTRFAVLFTAGGPTGRFADEQTISDRLSRLWAKIKGKDAKQS